MKMKTSSSTVSFRHRLQSGFIAAALGVSSLTTNFLGIADYLGTNSEVIHAEGSVSDGVYEDKLRSSDRGDYEAGHVYYDIGTLRGHAYYDEENGWTDKGSGTYAETGWHIYNVDSFLADESGRKGENIINTLPYTTDLNDPDAADFTRNQELMCWQVYATQDAYRNQYLERTDVPDAGIPTFDGDNTDAYYIAKGTVTADGSNNTVIEWDIRSWVVDPSGWIDPATFTKTDLTGLSQSVDDVSAYFASLTNADGEEDAYAELAAMWDKAAFDKDSAEVKAPFDDTIDTWWEGVASKTYEANVHIEGEKVNKSDKPSDGYTATITATGTSEGNGSLSYTLSRDNNLGALVANNIPVELIVDGKVSEKSAAIATPDVAANTFDASYGYYTNGSSISVDIDKSVLCDYLNSIAAYVGKEYTVIDDGGVTHKVRAFEPVDGKIYVAGAVLKDKWDGAEDKEDHWFAFNDSASPILVSFFKDYANEKPIELNFGGGKSYIIDAWIYDNDIRFDEKYNPITDAKVLEAINKNAADAEANVSASGIATADAVTFTFPDLSYLDTDYNRTNGHAVYGLIGSMQYLINLGTKVKADLKIHCATGYQRAAGSVKAQRPKELVDTFASTPDANNDTPAIGVASDKATITDRVDLTKLTEGTYYKLVGALYDVETGCAIKADGTISDSTDVITFDADTDFADYAISVQTFKADATEVSQNMTFSYNASALAGHKVVVLERLYLNNESKALVAEHINKADADQTITIATPDAGTVASDAKTGGKVLEVSPTVMIKDVVSYEGLVPGKTYTLIAQPVTKPDGTPITKKVGESDVVVTAEKTFVPTKANGTVEIEVEVDTTALTGKAIVMFETIKLGNKDIVVHADINDSAQTVTVKAPVISTVATADDNKSKYIDVIDGAIIIDKVHYEELIPGEEYTLKAELYDAKETKQAIESDEVKFTATDVSGDATVQIKFDTRTHVGEKFTVVEYLIYGKNEIARHYDLADEDQTITVKTPTLKTVAKSNDGAIGTVDCSENAVIVDEVSYTDLVVGQEYTLVASIYDVVAGKWVDDVATKIFTADAVNGKVNVDITYDTSAKKGQSFVVGEKLYIGGVQIADHIDTADEDQTVTVKAPSIKTKATGKDGKQIVDCTDALTINDTVEFYNLTVGEQYTMTAGIYDATTKEWVGESVGKTNFTAETENGSVIVKIDGIDTLNRQGHKLVVVEKLTSGTKTIANHDDLTDVDQTVTVKTVKISTVATGEDGEKVVDCFDKITINDTVSYTGLTVGKEYTMTAGLYDVTADKWIGKSVASETFTAETADGSVVVTIENVDTSALAGHDIVVYEYLKYNEIEIAKHEESTDKDQTVTVKTPSIKTNAYAADKESKRIDCTDKAVIVDTVDYKNLKVGATYTLTARLWDVNKGEYLADTAIVEFRSEASDGSVDVTIKNIDTTALIGDTIVVTEELKCNDFTYVNHDDLTDADQTVTVKGPSIKTIAMNATKDGKAIEVAKAAKIVDTVKLTDLAVGTEYGITVGLYDATDKDYVTDINVKASVDGNVHFTATAESMEMDVEINVDTTNRLGHKLVVVETLKTADKVVAEHTSTVDEDQTVEVKTPSIRTRAYDSTGKKSEIECGKNVTINDIVDYKNLEVGKEYTLVAGLYDATAKKMLTETAGTLNFTAKTADGQVTVVIENVDTTKYIGHKIVVLEKLITDDTTIVNHNDTEDVDQTVTVVTPRIGTLASDKISGNKIVDKSANAVIVDEVRYENLTPGVEYTLSATVYNKSDSALLDGVSATKKFTPTTANGTVSIEIKLDTTKLTSARLVVFESLAEGDTTIVEHKDENDEDQTVTVAYPGIKTKATVNGEKSAVRNEVTVIDDVVTYTGLTPGKTYTMTAELRDKATGEVVSSKSDAVTFTAEAASGTVSVKITVDTTAIKSTDLVVFEYLTSGDETIAVHTDIKDTDQTVSFVDQKHPAVATVATNKTLDSHNIDVAKSVVVVDKVSYTDLDENATYKLVSAIYDITDSADADKRVKLAETESEFKTTASNGTVSVDMAIDTTTLKGHTLVVAEYIYSGDELVVSHDDMTDKEQTVYVAVPKIRTTATSVATGTHTLERNATAQIVDRVVYTGLTPGEKYTVTATPYDKATGKALAGVKPVTVEFTAKAVDGYVDVTITIDTSLLAGKSIVMFESLKYEDVEIAVHNDINDEDQTVVVPTIDTVALSSGGSHTLKINENVTVVDTITYTGLTVGEEYSVSGQLVYKSDANKVMSSASMTFIPKTANGTVEISYTFNTAGHANESFVCFETITASDGTVIIDHKDINDADQTVTVEDTPTTTDTGDTSRMMFHFTLSGIFGAAFVFYVMYLRRRRIEG